VIDRKAVFSMKPERRAKWLTKALKQAADGLLRASDIYDVISSTRFAEDIPYKMGSKMNSAVQEHLPLFSGKQQRYLSSESTLSVKFGKKKEVNAMESSQDDKAAEEKSEAQMEEMMARCRAFVREKMLERGERSMQAQDDGSMLEVPQGALPKVDPSVLPDGGPAAGDASLADKASGEVPFGDDPKVASAFAGPEPTDGTVKGDHGSEKPELAATKKSRGDRRREDSGAESLGSRSDGQKRRRRGRSRSHTRRRRLSNGRTGPGSSDAEARQRAKNLRRTRSSSASSSPRSAARKKKTTSRRQNRTGSASSSGSSSSASSVARRRRREQQRRPRRHSSSSKSPAEKHGNRNKKVKH